MVSTKQMEGWIRQVRFFAGLDEETAALLIEQMGVTRFEKATYLCREGEPGEQMFIIESGTVSVQKKGHQDLAVEIAELQAGDVTGTASMFTRGRRSADLVASALTATDELLGGEGDLSVCAEGSLFWKAPGYAERVRRTVDELRASLGRAGRCQVIRVAHANLIGSAAAVYSRP